MSAATQASGGARPSALDATVEPRDVLLSARDLHTWFELRRWGVVRLGHVRAVDGVDFELRRGETVAFVGESGCGKSSLARTLLGIHRPTRGQVFFDGRDLVSLDAAGWRAHRARVGYVQQDPYGALAPFMDVRRILSEPLIVNGVRDAAERERRVREALEEVRLLPVDEFLGKFPHMLSGGQQQRVVIARALILKPALVIADEPVSMLDASVRVEILTLLREVQRARNLTLAFITHDLSTVRYFAERIFVMYAGRIVEQAPVDALLDTPRHPYTRALLAAIPDPDPDNATHYKDVPAGEPPSLLTPPSGCRFHPRCPAAIAGRCERDVPPDIEVGPSHRVACWLHTGDAGA
jgi:peptide/nickel transport system ATP-binding protein